MFRTGGPPDASYDMVSQCVNPKLLGSQSFEYDITQSYSTDQALSPAFDPPLFDSNLQAMPPMLPGAAIRVPYGVDGHAGHLQDPFSDENGNFVEMSQPQNTRYVDLAALKTSCASEYEC